MYAGTAAAHPSIQSAYQSTHGAPTPLANKGTAELASLRSVTVLPVAQPIEPRNASISSSSSSNNGPTSATAARASIAAAQASTRASYTARSSISMREHSSSWSQSVKRLLGRDQEQQESEEEDGLPPDDGPHPPGATGTTRWLPFGAHDDDDDPQHPWCEHSLTYTHRLMGM
jgi:hypothetical protein